MEYSEQKVDQLELMLDVGKTIDNAKSLNNEDLIGILSDHLGYFNFDAEIESIISTYFTHANLTRQERLKLEGVFVTLFTTYAFNDAGQLVGTILK